MTNTDDVISLEDVDRLMSKNWLSPPADFHGSVMARIAAEDSQPNIGWSTLTKTPFTRLTATCRWIAMGTAGLVGAIKLVSFIFGIWASTVAG
ncbi:MAG: hypothetical protein ACR2PS_17790 [Pseudomonadales bacterium]